MSRSYSPRNWETARVRPWLIAFLAVGVLSAAAWGVWSLDWFDGRAQAAGSSPGLSLSPTAHIANPGSIFAEDIVVDCGAHADCAATRVGFDPTHVQVVALTADTSVLSATLLSHYDNETGWLQYDAGSLYCHSAGNCPSGSIRLATITFRAVGAPGSAAVLSVTGEVTWEGLGVFQGAGTGSVIAITIAGDMDTDCDVDVVDIMLVASRWSSVLGQPLYDARYDLDADQDIDIVDIMFVASRWSQSCNLALSPLEEAE